MVPPCEVILNPRSVVSPPPMYFKVPESRTIFDTAFEVAPKFPATPPLFITATVSVPS